MSRFPPVDKDVLGVGEKNFVQHPDLEQLLLGFIERHRAGSPTDASVYWIHWKPPEIARYFFEEHAQKVSHSMVKRTLRTLGYRYRKMDKNLPTGYYAQRDQQFKIIFTLVAMMRMETPILSIDCKKKERLGNLHRAGQCYTQAPIEVYDHDYEHLSEGKVVPHGIYDMQRHQAYLSIGKSHETAEFIADNLLWWWDNYGIHHYPKARTILILCDAGGGNSYRHHAFKKHMLLLAREIGLDFILCHYPPYCSKWNPIEHQVFPHIHRAMQGAVFTNYALVQEVMQKTTTSTGLKIIVRINDKHYPTGIKTTKEQVDFQRIQFHQQIPKLSYRIAA